ncbi:MAG TPA: universal stress protein [Solirubrobacteraceae bacterium]|nr:universal stress protein [Solirubrobacteraceae bacterium]
MFKKVVWATDGSEAADQALPLARTLAAEGGGELLVVHCVELTVPGKAAGIYPIHADEDDLKAKIERQVAEVARGGVPARLQTTRATVGRAAQAIADAARDQQGEVIVVGTRGHTALGGLLLGSVTQRLLHLGSCPVLAVPTNGSHATS